MERVRAVEAALDRAIATAPVAADVAGANPGDGGGGPGTSGSHHGSLGLPDGPLGPHDRPLGLPNGPTRAEALAAFTDQVTSRALDVVARELRAAGIGYHTISSAGHEDNVALGALPRPTDPAFLHYRSGALFLARARQAGADAAMVDDVLCPLLANREDPVARGRHKVWDSRARWVLPQTSTIGSHLPKAVGTAIAIDRRRANRVAPATSAEVPDDAIAVASFGDASLNHATTQTAVNAARWSVRHGAPTPELFVCEDNGLGISVATPPGWVERSVSHLPDLAYLPARGELDELWAATAHAIDLVRSGRRPVFLHLETVRLWAHAGSDVEVAYRDRSAIEADEARDPLPRTARQLLAAGVIGRSDLQVLVAACRDQVRAREQALGSTPPLRNRQEVLAPLSPPPARPGAGRARCPPPRPGQPPAGAPAGAAGGRDHAGGADAGRRDPLDPA